MEINMHQIKYDYGYRNPAKISIPDQCPHCGTIMELTIVQRHFDYAEGVMILTAQCTASKCRKYFVLSYKFHEMNGPTTLIPYTYEPHIETNITKEVAQLSEEFANTYKEALVADSRNLTHITGISLRRAFEFLCKDFAIYQISKPDYEKEFEKSQKKPKTKEDIVNSSVNNIIDSFFKDMPALQQLSHVIRKLGNDETHYYRKYEQLDIQDFKRLIETFMLYIQLILQADAYAEMTK